MTSKVDATALAGGFERETDWYRLRAHYFYEGRHLLEIGLGYCGDTVSPGEAEVRDLILALQQWLATMEGMD